MHDAAFDQAMREGLRSVPRRRLLGLAAGLLALVRGGPDVRAKRKRKKRRCKPPRIKCGKKCLAAGACCTNADCSAVTGQVCVANTCRCPGGQVVAGGECAAPCSPVCDVCQRCDDGTCVDLAEGAACANGGVCRGNICKPDRSFGCTVAQNACATGAALNCPNNSANNTFCFVDLDGDPVCAKVKCTNDATGAVCPDLLGPGSFVQPCALICGPNDNKTHMCIQPDIE